MFNDEEQNEIRHYLNKVEGSVYIGCDSVRTRRFNIKSQRYKHWARYAVVLVVHINDSQGCKIFHYTEKEIDHDQNNNKPRLRLMNEVYKSVECYLAFADVLEQRNVEIHLDVNNHECHASNAVAKQAIGYVKGVTNIDALIKPHAWAGSCSADQVARQRNL